MDALHDIIEACGAIESALSGPDIVAKRFGRKSGYQEEVGSHPAAPPSPISLLVASPALS